MPQTLALANFNSLSILDQTQLTADVAAGANSLLVANTDDFDINGFVLIGTKGSKTSELLQAATVLAANTIPLAANTLLAHNQYDPDYSLFGDELKIYRAPNVNGSQPADVSFVPLSTVAIDPNDVSTMYTDSSGGSDYWYKYTHFNSVTNSETDLASSLAVRGTFSVAYCSLDEIRQEAGFKYATYIDDGQIDQERQAAQDKINGRLNKFYEVPLQPPIPDSLKQICIRLAAGYLRKAQFSAISNSAVNGQGMIDDAELELDKLVIKEEELMTKDGKSLAEEGGTGEAGGWPDKTTATADPSQGGAPRVFRMSDIQGGTVYDANGNAFRSTYYGRKW